MTGYPRRRIPPAGTKGIRKELSRGSSREYQDDIRPRRNRLAYYWTPIEDGAILTCAGGRQRMFAKQIKKQTEASTRSLLYIIDHDDPHNPVEFIGSYPALEEAQEAGEALATATFGIDTLGLVDQPWRSERATPPGIAMMRRNRRTPWPGITKGDTSDEIAFSLVAKVMSAYSYRKARARGQGPR